MHHRAEQQPPVDDRPLIGMFFIPVIWSGIWVLVDTFQPSTHLQLALHLSDFILRACWSSLDSTCVARHVFISEKYSWIAPVTSLAVSMSRFFATLLNLVLRLFAPSPSASDSELEFPSVGSPCSEATCIMSASASSATATFSGNRSENVINGHLNLHFQIILITPSS